MSEQAEKSSSVRERPKRQSSPEKPSEMELKKMKRVDRQLKRLSFQNPGPQVANFNPEIRQQIKKGQMAKKNEFVSVKREVNKYDKKGRLTFTCVTALMKAAWVASTRAPSVTPPSADRLAAATTAGPTTP